MSEFKTSGFRDEFGNAGPDLVGITTMTSPYYFVPPSGSTAERPSDPPPGMLRFNTDIGRLEVWRNDHWATILGESPNLGNQLVTNSAGGTGARAIFGGGSPGVGIDTLEYLTISTFGNTQDFGDLTLARRNLTAGSSNTRGVWIGGIHTPGGPVTTDRIDYVNFASTGDAITFGSLIQPARGQSASSNQTRIVYAGGNADNPSSVIHYNNIEYVTTASTGNALDFGDLPSTNSGLGSNVSSPVRGLFAGGYNYAITSYVNTINYVTFSTTGNALDFGDLYVTCSVPGGVSSSTRGVFAGGGQPGSVDVNVIQFITMSSTGNSQDFGDMTESRFHFGNTASDTTRGLFAGGYNWTPGLTVSKKIDSIQIATTGNAVDFGDLTSFMAQSAGCSNGHGGL